MRRSSHVPHRAPEGLPRPAFASLGAALASWRSRIAGRYPSSRRRRAHRAATAPEPACVDLLEDRCLLSPLGGLRAQGHGPNLLGRHDFDRDGDRAGNVTVVVDDGDLIVLGGEGPDRVEIRSDAATGQIVVTGLEGTTVNGQSAPFTVAAGIDDLIVETGEAGDQVIIQGIVIAGDLEIETGEGSDVVLITDATIGGDLEIETGEAHDLVALQNVTVAGETEIETGEGHDDVLIDGGAFGGEAAIDTGEGHDVVLINGSTFADDAEFETDEGHDRLVVENSTFQDEAFAETGDGHDSVAIFVSAFADDLEVELDDGHDRLILQGLTADEVEADGGDGFDTLITDFGDVDEDDFERFGAAFDRAAFFNELEEELALRFGLARDELNFDDLDDAIEFIIDEILEELLSGPQQTRPVSGVDNSETAPSR